MDVYLTEEELLREENLFAPHVVSYKALKGREFDIASLKEKVEANDNAPKAPASC